MKAIRTLLRTARTVGDSVRSIAAPGALVRALAVRPDRERIVPGPIVDEPPTTEEVVAAIEEHEKAREQYNAGGRGKRTARKILDRTRTGEYGIWSVTWIQSSRRDWDRDAIAAVFAELGREIPTKPSAPTLKLTRAEQVTELRAA
ncbi:hypothetical protein [Streptomyces sp. NBC_00989]|uniref:hypothetical protein n=1 Tax=Streptomyces sp. NBC_00989 TaxID=2903705 RepID=UPI0038706956|nr:hypothetical protein OG714_38325 [Streptomyces sp. NBC_00989]